MHRPLLGLLLGSVVASAATATPPTVSSRQLHNATAYYQIGERALLSGNFGRARSNFERAVRIFPLFPEAHMGLGHVAMGERRFEDALREYECARENFTGVGNSILGIEVEQYSRVQEQVTALHTERAEIERMIRTNPTVSTFAEMRLGQIESEIHHLEVLGRPGDEASKIEAPAELDFHVGNALFRLERLDEAIVAWEECLRHKPDFPLVHNNLAVAYWKKGRYEEANASLSRAASLGLKVNPEFKADLERTLLVRSAAPK